MKLKQWHWALIWMVVAFVIYCISVAVRGRNDGSGEKTFRMEITDSSGSRFSIWSRDTLFMEPIRIYERTDNGTNYTPTLNKSTTGSPAIITTRRSLYTPDVTITGIVTLGTPSKISLEHIPWWRKHLPDTPTGITIKGGPIH